jgi:peptide/nickel transport system substrate-binding protein
MSPYDPTITPPSQAAAKGTMRSIGRCALLVLVAGCAVMLAACGSSSKAPATGSTSSAGAGSIETAGFKSPATESLTGGKRGGTLHVLQEADFENLDPGISYYAVDYEVVYATQRPLFSALPNSLEAGPDLAARPAVISPNGKLVTIEIKHGIHFSPPVNREVTSADVAYAMERGANPNVANPYFHAYFESIEGAPNANGGPIKGITTPNRYTIVFKLTEPKGQIVVEALQLPLSAPVPKEYAEKFDARAPSDYADYQVATGPYMLKNDAAGKVLGIGYVPGKSATLVRNPNWTASTDARPAYLNEIQIKMGGDGIVIGRQVLEGSGIVDAEAAPQPTVKLAYEKFKSQMEISPGAGMHYIALNNKQGPFANIDLRKALWAATDRAALDKARGGELVTNVATHFIFPTIPGFEQAGGLAGPKGPQFDFDEHPEGDIAIAEKYMRLAGYPSGKYTGAKAITVVGATTPPEKEDAEIVDQTLKGLGFKTELTLVETATMYDRYCSVPKEEIDVCPSVAWVADFPDPQTVLNITFNGKLIVATDNTNYGQVAVPKIDDEMAEGERLSGIKTRANFWAKIDDQLVENAVAVPFDWDKQANIESSDVAGIGDLWDSGEWDYSWTSLR